VEIPEQAEEGESWPRRFMVRKVEKVGVLEWGRD
jgi:hypothetical protein